MWSGAVNRQPGYRARNLQRRGFIALRVCFVCKQLPDDSWWNFNFSENVDFSKIFGRQKGSAPAKKTSINIEATGLRLCRNLKTMFFHTDLQIILKINCGISQGSEKTRSKFWLISVPCSGKFTLAEYYFQRKNHLLCKISHVERRGKPPTWYPRRKLPAASWRITTNFLRK